MLRGILTGFFVFFVSNVSAQSEEAPWILTGYRCVFQCSKSHQQIINAEIGRPLFSDISTNSAPLLATCSGKVTFKTSETPTRRVLKELNGTVPPVKRFTPKNTGLNTEVVHSGNVYCTEPDGQSRSTYWILDMTSDTMLVYFEGETILILNKKTAAL